MNERGKELLGALTDAQRRSLDEHIVQGSILMGLQYLRDEVGLNLQEAHQTFVAEYDELRKRGDSRFVRTHERYWEGFYS